MPVAHHFDQKFDSEAVSGRVGFVSSRFCSEIVSNLTGTVKLSTMTLAALVAAEDVKVDVGRMLIVCPMRAEDAGDFDVELDPARLKHVAVPIGNL